MTVLFVLTALAASNPAASISMDDVRTVELFAMRGLEVSPSDDAQVHVVDGDYRVTRNGQRLVVHGARSLTVRVPETWIELRNQSGGVRLTGKFPRVAVRIASGGVTLNVDADEVDLESLSGDVTVEGRVKELRIRTVSGDVKIGAAGLENVRVSVTNGDVDLTAPKQLARRVEVDSINGDLTLLGGLAKDGNVRVRTQSGRITLKRRGTGLRLEAQARYGRLTVAGESKPAKDTWIGDVGGGGADVRLSTFSGRIVVD